MTTPAPIQLKLKQARRFLLAFHNLLPPGRLQGKTGILDYVERTGCIQYDPVNVLAFNPDLVLQSRVKNYRQALLDQLLYRDRKLVQGWDKVSSFFQTGDWPNFTFRREEMREYYLQHRSELVEIVPQFLEEIRRKGPMSSLDFKENHSINWSWGQPTRVARAALEVLYDTGQIQVHHRTNTRRYFDLIERLLPEEVLRQEHPHPDLEAYHDWHVLRRIGGLGLADPTSSDVWQGISGAKSSQRRAALKRLMHRDLVREVVLESVPGKNFYMRTQDLAILESALSKSCSRSRASLIAVLDNLIWDRKMVQQLFDFEYIWEIYKPAASRKYGYYVLPVLYGERFIARCDLALDRKTSQLVFKNWWWEPDVRVSDSMVTAIESCFRQFMRFLEVHSMTAGSDMVPDEHLQRMV
jgi:uncharacterized protein YcaQ